MHHELIFNSEMKEILSFRKKMHPAGKYLSEKPTIRTNIDEVIVKGDCVDGKRESVLFSFGLSAPPGLKFSKNVYQS